VTDLPTPTSPSTAGTGDNTDSSLGASAPTAVPTIKIKIQIPSLVPNVGHASSIEAAGMYAPTLSSRGRRVMMPTYARMLDVYVHWSRR